MQIIPWLILEQGSLPPHDTKKEIVMKETDLTALIKYEKETSYRKLKSPLHSGKIISNTLRKVNMFTK